MLRLPVSLSPEELNYLCKEGIETLMSEPTLLELEAPIKVCGDIHGQYLDLLRLFEYGGQPPDCKYLFLGDYVDRGKHSIETICLLLAFKIRYPDKFFILRGNHECASINRIYGFFDECRRRYNAKTWKTFCDVFNSMPIAAIIDDRIFCTHGGLSPELTSMEQIKRIPRPTDVPDQGGCTGNTPARVLWKSFGKLNLHNLSQVFCVISSGVIQKGKSGVGGKTIEGYPSHLAKTLLASF
mmetsp:Transcript_10514/g.43792  ORF Transcript_10514/g.43792 Transcript_10514/m.43792 type:complete len:240 (+) Transcript_10514:661-1380(+)